MASSHQKGFQAYQRAHENELEQSTLILMMYSGGIAFLDKALEVIETDKAAADNYISKAKNVIIELMSSLNLDEGGDMGRLLFKTYKGLYIKLTVADIRNDYVLIADVRKSLGELAEAWKQVFQSDEYRLFKSAKTRMKAFDCEQR